MQVYLESVLSSKLLNKERYKNLELYKEFVDSIMEYVVSDIYFISDDSVLVDNLDYLCDILERNLKENEKDNYFRELLVQVINIYNKLGFCTMIWQPLLEEESDPVFEKFGMCYFYKTGSKTDAKNDFITFIKGMTKINLEVFDNEERTSKLRQYFKSRGSVG